MTDILLLLIYSFLLALVLKRAHTPHLRNRKLMMTIFDEVVKNGEKLDAITAKLDTISVGSTDLTSVLTAIAEVKAELLPSVVPPVV